MDEPLDLDPDALFVDGVFSPVLAMFAMEDPAESGVGAGHPRGVAPPVANPAMDRSEAVKGAVPASGQAGAGSAGSAGAPPGAGADLGVATSAGPVARSGHGPVDPTVIVAPSRLRVTAGGGALSPTLSLEDMAAFLQEHRRSLAAKLKKVEARFAGARARFSAATARLMVTVPHSAELYSDHMLVHSAIEQLLQDQLVAAIGKHVTEADFSEYMAFHCRQLFRADRQPRPFSHLVRRPERCPDGVVSIEAGGAGGSAPVQMISAQSGGEPLPMRFPLSAAADVTFGGERFVHGCVLHQFSVAEMGGATSFQLQLVARARRFQSFVLLVGRIASNEVFEPSAAIIIASTDELVIPLLLDTFPSQAEFDDAIGSLSPEQRRFAEAFRDMQLSHTLFGVCVLEIRPQLEKVLNLPAGALTKQIALQQQLAELFITHHIPPDLLCYSELGGQASAAAKTAAVQAHADRVEAYIAEARRAELAEAEEKARKAAAAADAPVYVFVRCGSNFPMEGEVVHFEARPSHTVCQLLLRIMEITGI